MRRLARGKTDSPLSALTVPTLPQTPSSDCFDQRFRQGVGGRGLTTNNSPKNSPKKSLDTCPPSPKGA